MPSSTDEINIILLLLYVLRFIQKKPITCYDKVNLLTKTN